MSSVNRLQGRYRVRLRAILANQGAAYGFTLTVGGSGMLAAAFYGPFTVPEVLLFLAGPLLMYALLVMAVYHLREEPEELQPLRPAAYAFLDFLSVPAGIGTALTIYTLVKQPMIGIPLGSFLATTAYNLLQATQLLIFTPRE